MGPFKFHHMVQLYKHAAGLFAAACLVASYLSPMQGASGSCATISTTYGVLDNGDEATLQVAYKKDTSLI